MTVEKLSFKDDYIFYRTLQLNPNILKGIVELITKKEIGEIRLLNAQ